MPVCTYSVCNCRTASDAAARQGEETRMNSLKHFTEKQKAAPLLHAWLPGQHSPRLQDELGVWAHMPITTFTCWGVGGVLAPSGHTVPGRGLRGRGVWVKGDPLTPAQHPLPVMGTLPQLCSPASRCPLPHYVATLDIVTLTEVTEKGPNEWG